MAKILIEFYSDKTPENLISILNEHFDGVFFFYSSSKCALSHRKKTSLSQFVEKTLGFAPVFSEIPQLSVSSAVEALSKIQNDSDSYYLDITGGDEAFIAAAGIMVMQKGARFHLHQYHVPTGKKLFSYPESQEESPVLPRYVSATELLTLNGTAPLSAPSYVFSRGPLKGEILRLWNAVRACPKDWNRFCSLSEDCGASSSLYCKVLDNNVKAAAYRAVSARLKNAGIISRETEKTSGGKTYMEFEANVPKEATFLYEKAGNLLEMYCALCAHDCGAFHDIRVGVILDWNGTIAPSHVPDPRNEIDLILMRENLPILASCKNTAPQNEHLYEIMIMAKHYGGHFATPVLFATGKATETVKKRAKEMGITLIDAIRYKSQKALMEQMQNIGNPFGTA